MSKEEEELVRELLWLFFYLLNILRKMSWVVSGRNLLKNFFTGYCKKSPFHPTTISQQANKILLTFLLPISHY
jgi:hypothetical protein